MHGQQNHKFSYIKFIISPYLNKLPGMFSLVSQKVIKHKFASFIKYQIYAGKIEYTAS